VEAGFMGETIEINCFVNVKKFVNGTGRE